MSLVTGLFFLVLLLNQRWYPPLRLQASHCSTFRIMCHVSSTAVFCNESIECFPDTASKFFLKLLVTMPVAPIIIGIIVHFRFHIHWISIHKLLYFNFFSASFCTTFLSVCMFSLCYYYYYYYYLGEILRYGFMSSLHDATWIRSASRPLRFISSEWDFYFAWCLVNDTSPSLYA